MLGGTPIMSSLGGIILHNMRSELTNAYTNTSTHTTNIYTITIQLRPSNIFLIQDALNCLGGGAVAYYLKRVQHYCLLHWTEEVLGPYGVYRGYRGYIAVTVLGFPKLEVPS